MSPDPRLKDPVTHIPRDKANDYTPGMMAARWAFVKEQSEVDLDHIGRSTIDPTRLPGNIEQAIDAAQILIGLSGPLLVHGSTLTATSMCPWPRREVLVASYNRDMRRRQCDDC